MADKIYSMPPMGARGRARDLQPPSLIDCGNFLQTKFTVCRLWAPRGRARGTYSPLGCWNHVAPHVVGNFSSCWRNFGKMMYANCIFSHFSPCGEDCRKLWKLLPLCQKISGPPLPRSRFIPNISRSIYSTGYGNFKQSCRLNHIIVS